MIRIGIADYGMNCWYGGFYDYAARMDEIKAIGYDGIERLRAAESSEVLRKAALLAERGMDFGTVESTDIEQSIRWTAAFRKTYMWCNVLQTRSLDEYIRRVSYQAAACKKYGICPAIHNHLGSVVESQEELERFLAACPDAGMILDIGHLGAAGGNVPEIFDRYYDRIRAIHLKDWKLDAANAVWLGKGYFCALGEGELVEENRYVVEQCVKRGYSEWIFVEQDTHLREPLLDLADSRRLIAKWGV